MSQVTLRFYEELNDFLAPDLRKRDLKHNFDRRTSVKDMIESFGVPHTEVELILVDGTSVDFSHTVQDGERISIYPMFEGLDVTPVIAPATGTIAHAPAFILDANLGRLARYLRLLGFDCLYRNDYEDRTVAETARREQRTVLTRDRALLRTG